MINGLIADVTIYRHLGVILFWDEVLMAWERGRLILRWLNRAEPFGPSGVSLRLVAHMLRAALIEIQQWCYDHDDRERV